jgi:uncharacterized membrane protein YczE
MDLEYLVWGIIPLIIAVCEIIYSVYLTYKKQKLNGFISTLLIIILNGLAIYILAQILLDAYPTYTPHLFILISTIILIIQYYKRKKTVANTVYNK